MKSNKIIIITVVLAVLALAVNTVTLIWYFSNDNTDTTEENVPEVITAEFFPLPDRIIVHSPEKEIVLEPQDDAFADIIRINESRVFPNWIDSMGGRGFIADKEEIVNEKYVEYVYDDPEMRVYPYYNEFEHLVKSFIFYVNGEWNTCVCLYEVYDGDKEVYHRFGDLNPSSEFVNKVNEILK